MNEEQTLLLKVGGEGGFVEILQDSNGSFIYHNDQSSYKDFLPHDKNEIDKDTYTFDTLQEAIGQINLSLLVHGVILYADEDMGFDIKLAIHNRIKNL